MLQVIKTKVKALAGNDLLYFGEACIINNAPYLNFHIWGVSVTENNKVMIMDSELKWHEVTEGKEDRALVYHLFHYMQKYVFTSNMQEA